MTTLAWVGLGGWLVVMFVWFRRIHRVEHYRLLLLDHIDVAIRARIAATDFTRHATEYEQYRKAVWGAWHGVGFGRMVLWFYRPLRSFYAGSILESEGLLP
jgi:hypothetical protein